MGETQIIDGLDPGTRNALCTTITSLNTRLVKQVLWFAPGRREAGHGALGERALISIAKLGEFPYTIRLVAESIGIK